MTRKHYEAIAATLRQSLDHYLECERNAYDSDDKHCNTTMARKYAYARAAIEGVAFDMADALSSNVSFQRIRFLNACGVK